MLSWAWEASFLAKLIGSAAAKSEAGAVLANLYRLLGFGEASFLHRLIGCSASKHEAASRYHWVKCSRCAKRGLPLPLPGRSSPHTSLPIQRRRSKTAALLHGFGRPRFSIVYLLEASDPTLVFSRQTTSRSLAALGQRQSLLTTVTSIPAQRLRWEQVQHL